MPKKSSPRKDLPLAVDLDGTLHHGDLTAMMLGWALWRKPFLFITIVRAWLFYGRAAMKMAGAAHAGGFSPHLEWDTRVLAWVLKEHARGREVVVVTGSAQAIVRRILRENGLPFRAIGTVSSRLNLIASNKARLLVEAYGEKGFDYVGNSRDDLKVWPHARHAIVANAPPHVLNGAEGLGNVVKVFPPA